MIDTGRSSEQLDRSMLAGTGRTSATAEFVEIAVSSSSTSTRSHDICAVGDLNR